MPRSRSEKGLISALLALKFEEHVMLKPKGPTLRNHAKTLCFCMFFEYPRKSTNEDNNLTTASKKHEKSRSNSSFLGPNFDHLRDRSSNVKF